MKYPIESEEKRTINRITFQQSVSDFLNAFNVERGLVYTIKNLFAKPGQLIRYYLGDGRYKVVNPFRLLILTTALSLLVMYLSDFQSVFNEMEEGFSEGFDKTESGYINEIMFDWYNLLLWISIPIFALITFLFNRQSKYNYAENLVLQAFYFSSINLLMTIMMPLNWVLDNGVVFIIVFVPSIIYYFYLISSFYQRKGIWFLVKNIFGYLIAYLLYTIVLTTILGVLIMNAN